MTFKKTVDITSYRTNTELTSFSQRAAHFLDWAAQRYPGMFFHPTVILQGIAGMSKTPRSNSQDVASVKNSVGRAQKYLLQDYKRGLVSESGVGYRATTNSEDAMRHTVTKKAVRFNGARVQLQKAMDIVNPKEISTATEEGKALKAYYFTLKDSTKLLFSEDFERRLLPAPKTDATNP